MMSLRIGSRSFTGLSRRKHIGHRSFSGDNLPKRIDTECPARPQRPVSYDGVILMLDDTILIPLCM